MTRTLLGYAARFGLNDSERRRMAGPGQTREGGVDGGDVVEAGITARHEKDVGALVCALV